MHTLRSYRRALAEVTGFFALSTTTGASTATNSLTLGDLADGALETKHYNGAWVLPCSTTTGNDGIVRRISNDGYTPATGITVLSRAYSSATPSGVEIEVHGVIPPIRQAGQIGWNSIINQALRECWQIDTLVITPATSTTLEHDLSTCPWLVQESNLIDVWYRTTGASTDSLVREWRLVPDMNSPKLELKETLSTTTELKPKLYRPMDTWIRDATSSAWANSTAGLVNDLDQALLPMEGMLRIGRAIAYEHLATRGDLQNQELYEKLALRWRQRADSWKVNLPRQAGRDVHWTTQRAAVSDINIISAVG